MKLILSIFFLSSSAFCSESINYNEFIKLAQENDPEFELLISDKERLKFLIDQGLPTRSLLLTVRNEYGFSSQNSNTKNLSTTVSKNILESGTKLSATHSTTTRPDRDENVIQLRLEQALLNNFFGRNLRLQKDILKDEVQKYKLEILELYEGYLVDIGNIYFTFSEAYYNYDLSKRILSESEQLKKNIEAKIRKKIASQLDLDRVSLQVFNSKEDYINKKNIYIKSLSELEKILGRKYSELKPEISIPQFTTKSHNKISFEKLRTYQKEIISNRIQEQNKQLAERADNPELNLIAGYNKDESSRFNTPINREEKVVGLEFSVPFDDTKSKAGELQAALELKKSKIRLQVLKLQLTANFESSKQELENLKELLEITKNKKEVTERILKEEERRFHIGKQTLERLIETKKEFSQYRYKYYSTMIEYNKKVLDWKNLNDYLIDSAPTIF